MITARAMAKSSAFCAPRKNWPGPTLRPHSQHKGVGPPGLQWHPSFPGLEAAE